MTPSSGACGGLDLVAVSRLAMAELGADAVLVECGAGIAVLGGPADDELLTAVRRGTGDPRVTSLTDGGASVHVLHRTAPEDPGRCRDLLQAFARHIAVILGRDDAPPDPDGDGVLAVDDLPLLPDAVIAITGRVAGMMQPLTGATAAGITVWDAEHGILRALPGAFGANDDVVAASVTGRVTNLRSATSRVLTTGQPYLSNRASGDPGIIQSYVDIFEITRILSVPLNNGGRRIGVLHLVNKPTDFTIDDITATERVAPRIAIAVELALAVARMSAQQRLEGVLTSVAVAVATGRGVQDGLLPAFRQLADVTAASLVALVPPDSPPLLCRRGEPDPELERRVIDEGRTFGSPSSHGELPRAAGDPGWTVLRAPVEVHGHRTATLAVLRRSAEPFTDAESDVVTRLAALVGLAWATEQYQRQLAEITLLQERERIADELHDRVSQILYAAGLGLDTLLEQPDTAPDDRERLLEVRRLVVGGDVAIRDVIHDLARAPGAQLSRRLRREVQAVEEEFAVAVRTEIPDDDVLAPIPRTVADALVRVAREGTVNAAKHAGPCRIALTVRVDQRHVGLTVLDDGLGLPESRWLRVRGDALDDSRGHGVAALRRTVEDAGGTIAIASPDGGFGTRLECRFAL
ncbi:hypothetical protein GCM10017691_18620 [Pseudonocardia petroleophila]|uniref:GAF domain-containing protein n=1 Tax=Pseudonocardia petroleophila TaxID=37331 RepID=A0A7G7MH32_9PSEU|nr:GAF domain-containing protein [Pseudonocardia petroleophila]QNG52093.1 GAF domain-containing protein [Pseudonocardia petroleophila]